MKSDLFFLLLGSTILFPAIVLIVSGEIIPFLMGCFYSIAIGFILPKRFWQRFWIANKHITKFWEG